jgi:hypothetical protein
MSNFKEKAEKLKFLNKKNQTDPISSVGPLSLKTSAKLSTLILFIQELAFIAHIFTYFEVYQFWFIYVITFSLYRMAVLVKFKKGINTNNYILCEKMYIKMKKLTKIQIFNLWVILILWIFEVRVSGHQEIWELSPLVTTIFTFINMGLLLVLFSFTKHLGFGDLELINGKVGLGYVEQFVPTTRANVTNLTVGNVVVDNINSYPTISSSSIVLTNSMDLAFAHSAQNAVVDDVVLPSGLKVPAGQDGKSWRIIGNEIVMA